MNTKNPIRNAPFGAAAFRAIPAFIILVLASLALPARAADLSSEAAKPTTVAVFSDRAMAPVLWTDILDALQNELSSGELPEASVSFNAQIIRGDQMPLGLEVDSSITIYLHGDCNLALRTSFAPPHHIAGALGWVQRKQGQIEPFINVDCSLIADLLRSRPAFVASFGNQAQRFQAMSVAIARVVLHEYVHIASQSSAHTRHGISKSEFTANDLIAPIPVTIAESHTTLP